MGGGDLQICKWWYSLLDWWVGELCILIFDLTTQRKGVLGWPAVKHGHSIGYNFQLQSHHSSLSAWRATPEEDTQYMR
jgi:hypothetical protein